MIKKILIKIENYFLFLFDKYFKLYIKPYMIKKDFDSFFDGRFEYIFSNNFEKELRLRFGTFNIDNKNILDCIKTAESKIRVGNGDSKMEYACNFFVEQNKGLIMDMAKGLIRQRVQDVFMDNKDEINAMIIRENICL